MKKLSYFDSGKPYLYMPDTYVIFICTFDPFGRGLPIYTLETKCNEIDLPEYKDGVYKIFFNKKQIYQNFLKVLEVCYNT